MTSAASPPPVLERVAGIRTIAESGRFKASSSPLFFNRNCRFTLRLFKLEPVVHAHLVTAKSVWQTWLLDQFGVLHDGKKPYPGAILACTLARNMCSDFFCSYCLCLLSVAGSATYVDYQLVVAVEKLAGNGAKMVIISNSSRRSSVTMEKLKSLGFDTSCFLATITSGELTHQHLLKRNDPWFAALGRKCIHITWGDRGAISLEGLGLQVVNNVDDAEFILAHGTEALDSPSGDPLPKSLEELEQILMLGLEKRLPMVVANPDYVTVEARDLRVMPGTLAAKYENLGGEVKWMGKPDKVIYKSAMSLAGVDAHECIMVGDSLHHDIKGANASGIASVLITGGIHADELGLREFGETAEEDAIRTLSSKHGSYPSYVLPSFTW
ncbi:hypothetical protein HU200_062016 [Digitaria exilis]|uniref:Uncharacterized protein n=1 Tax=Digitaria exilis TaxID=1010633 RepID=A0A835AGG6_9POAL|nr:hypothetical protein HU200_062016 [Digitaria exilis]